MVVDKLRALYPVKALCGIFDIHRSSYRYWCRPKAPDAERTVKRSLVSEAWNVSGGSAGARRIATIVTNTYGVKLGRWLAGKLMEELNIISCQTRKHQYKRGEDERVDIPNLLNRQFSVTGPD